MHTQLKFTATLSRAEYDALRLASMRGQLNTITRYQRDIASGEVTVWTRDSGFMFKQLERVIDFGAITAPEAFGAVPTSGRHDSPWVPAK